MSTASKILDLKNDISVLSRKKTSLIHAKGYVAAANNDVNATKTIVASAKERLSSEYGDNKKVTKGSKSFISLIDDLERYNNGINSTISDCLTEINKEINSISNQISKKKSEIERLKLLLDE